MTKSKPTNQALLLPALKGVMGDWVFYSCLMEFSEIESRIKYAEDIHDNKSLSLMIQRRLDQHRSREVAEYIKTQEQRFFNSLVIATYDGQPNWHGLSGVQSFTDDPELRQLSEETVESVGFLSLRGDEELFAVDGQHRLSGIKRVVNEGWSKQNYDEVSVIFVAHRDTREGRERTRRLFTTLNKTSKPVSKGDIIALDEDDVMAICVRRLIEETDLFRDNRIAFVANNNLPATNRTNLTTIGNLYDVLTILFTNANSELKKKKTDLQRSRPDDKVLDKYFTYSKIYFNLLRQHFSELDDFFTAENTGNVVRRHRGRRGGMVLFRPIGLEIYTRIISQLTKDMTLSQAVRMASKLPRKLNEAPYAGLMWDTSNRTMLNGHKVTLREILCYMINKNGPNYPEDELLERYRREIANPRARLPSKLT